MKKTEETPATRRGPGGDTNRLRRRLLLFFPLGVFAGIAGVLASAAARFLGPPPRVGEGDGSDDAWVGVAPVSELSGEVPVARTLEVENTAGWSRSRTRHLVYVLPRQGNRVVSAICPHEDCEVAWRLAERDFFCPCHDSRFDEAGERLSGPAPRGLHELPSRVTGGVLEVRSGALTRQDAQGASGRA